LLFRFPRFRHHSRGVSSNGGAIQFAGVRAFFRGFDVLQPFQAGNSRIQNMQLLSQLNQHCDYVHLQSGLSPYLIENTGSPPEFQ